ncbi:MAG: FlgD immunoglobulin-like domain containing protein, partial [Gemmatimonadota bacterium]
FVVVAGGSSHSQGLKSDGTIVAWGNNYAGQCNVPEPNADFVAVAAGRSYNLGLKSDGTIVTWGCDIRGQCDVPLPRAGFVAVAAGYWHGLGLKSNRRVEAWGLNNYGQCDVPLPNSNFVAVAGGYGHSLGLKSDGTVVAWGDNQYGQCNVPAPNADFVAAAAGKSQSLGLKSDGAIVAWGLNDYHQCDIPSPNADFVAVAGGAFHSLGIRSYDTPVETVFYATLVHDDRAVLLRWSLPGCSGGVGLMIYRALSADGPYGCITPEPLPDAALGSYIDENAWPGGTFWYELRALLTSGEEVLVTDIHPSVVVPGTLVFGIRYVMPNPATAHASIGYTLPEGWRSARLSVHDVSGRLVRQLHPTTGAQGFVAVDWDGTDSSGERVASGVYFVRLEVDGAMATQRMVVLR